MCLYAQKESETDAPNCGNKDRVRQQRGHSAKQSNRGKNVIVQLDKQKRYVIDSLKESSAEFSN